MGASALHSYDAGEVDLQGLRREAPVIAAAQEGWVQRPTRAIGAPRMEERATDRLQGPGADPGTDLGRGEQLGQGQLGIDSARGKHEDRHTVWCYGVGCGGENGTVDGRHGIDHGGIRRVSRFC